MGTAESQGELWGAAPEGWATIQERQHRPLFESMLNAAKVVEGSDVLDAGCGSGTASELAAARGARVSGIDAAEGLIAFAKERVPGADFRVGDIEHLPFDDDAFTAVIAPNSVQYSGDRVATLRGFARVCQEGGHVVAGLFGAPDKVAFMPVFGAIRDALPEPPPGKGPFELSAPGVLESLFEEAGLTIIDIGEVDCPFIYADFDEFWLANASAGPLQGAMRVIGEGALKEALRKPVEAFQQPDGRIEIGPNYFKYIVASA
jgi:SAM-dependent methyltransferase